MAETFFKEVQMCRKILLVLLILVVTAGSLSAQSVDIPERKRNNIIVASYNIKWLGEWPHEYDSLAAVIQHFDVCGILEVTDEDGLPPLIEALEDKTGRDWGYVYGIRTHRPGGSYQEAYAAVWRRDRVELGDGVVSGIWDWEEAFRNDPFIVSFKRRNFDFNLLLIHTRWSSDTCGTRAGEVATIAKQINWMRTFLQERDIILAGDFNYSGSSDAMIAMADSAGLTQIDPNHKSTFKADYSDYASSYDHMYIDSTETTEYVTGSCQTMDATEIVYGDNSEASMQASKRELSDHLPVWAEFKVAGADDD